MLIPVSENLGGNTTRIEFTEKGAHCSGAKSDKNDAESISSTKPADVNLGNSTISKDQSD